MIGAPPEDVIQAVIFLMVSAIAVLIAIFGLAQWLANRDKRRLPAWRRTMSAAGAIAIFLQLAGLFAMWVQPDIGRERASLAQWSGWIIAAFFVALPCAVFADRSSRWWFLASSVLLFLVSFPIVLTV